MSSPARSGTRWPWRAGRATCCCQCDKAGQVMGYIAALHPQRASAVVSNCLFSCQQPKAWRILVWWSQCGSAAKRSSPQDLAGRLRLSLCVSRLECCLHDSKKNNCSITRSSRYDSAAASSWFSTSPTLHHLRHVRSKAGQYTLPVTHLAPALGAASAAEVWALYKLA